MLINGEKYSVCKECGEEKSIEDFYIYKVKGKFYTSTLCKECKKERVRTIYYSIRNRVITSRREEGERTDMQPEFFKEIDNVVYARLIWFDEQKRKWHDEFVPVIRMSNVAECYQFISIARDLTTADLKRLHYEFKVSERNKKALEDGF